MESGDNSKNTKAFVLTLVWHGLLLLFFIFVGFKIPQPPPPPQDLGIEVNLGNSDVGSGTEQPLSPGDPAPVAKPHIAAAKAQAPPTAPAHIETNDNNNDDQPAITQPKKAKISQRAPVIRETAPKVTHQTVAQTPPAPRRPSAVMTAPGASGPGGNDQDAFNKSRDEGIAGGHGDQGKPNGDPNSKNYNGNGGTGHSGAAIVRGLQGRTFSLPSFEGDFNENAKVAVDLKVDRNGHVISKSFQPRGSTVSDGSSFANRALELASQLKFNAGNVDEQTGTIVFSFKVRE